MAIDPDDFLKLMLRWLNAFVPKPGQTIPGVEDEMFDNITVPTLIIRGGENDLDHPKRTSLEVSCLIKGSELIDPPWPEDAWERAGEARASGKVKRFNMFDTWVQAAPAILKFLGSRGWTLRRLRMCTSQLSDASSAVWTRLSGTAFQVGLAQRHVDHVEAVIAWHAFDVAGETESGQHAEGVVVGSPADESEHAWLGLGAEGVRAQRHRTALELVGVGARHQHLDFPPRRGHCGEVVLEHLDACQSRTTAEVGHAVG